MVKDVVGDDSVRFDLIDFNSFSTSIPKVADHRYPFSHDNFKTYVYVQVVLLGMHWTLKGNQGAKMVSPWCRVLNKFCSINKKKPVTDADFKDAFTYFLRKFPNYVQVPGVSI